MATATKITNLVQSHQSTPPGMLFYNSLESVRSNVDLLGYVSVIERAWQQMRLDGVLCLDARPVLYLKEYSRPFSLRERFRLQKLFWNQGVANVLVLADPTSIFIYSGLTKPQNEIPDENATENALIETLALADYVQRIQTLYHDLATGHYYESNRSFFNPEQTVDSWLLDNLRAFRNALIRDKNGLSAREAHAFIGRVLFLCYLLDREIVPIGQPSPGQTGTMYFAKILDSYPGESRFLYLYELFRDLKDRFNGNMFDQDLDNEQRLIRNPHLDKMILFLGGHEVESGQRYLGFWPYNFKMIPVETISAIYEDFLTMEDPVKQRGRGAFYTPRFLAEMVVDTAVRDEPNILNGSFLDPACGSGIFLVILFNRLANRWIQQQVGRISYAAKAKAFQTILAHQIRGIDIELTACRIACFSLYLAYLDFFDPPDIQKYVDRTGQPLPKLLDYGDAPNHPAADIPVILKTDFLADETLHGETFDCIIGNPPWKGRQSKLSALSFLKKAPQYLKDGGTGCLLLPVKILHNQTDSFQAEWLMRVTLERVLQLADYRFQLFQNALCPAFIALFKNTPPQPVQHKFEFTAPKFSRDGLRKGIITISPSSRTWLPLSDVLSATQSQTAPVVWKRHLWGTPRDQKLLDLLLLLPSLKEHVDVLSELRIKRLKRTKSWVAGEGIKPWPLSKNKSDRNPKPIVWPLDMPFVEATPWISDLIVFEDETISFQERLKKKRYRIDALYSQPPADLFRSPMVLVSQGFGKVAYCDFDVLFQHSLQSIAGPKEDADLLMFLAAYLGSNLARYFLFHTAANWGTERDKVHLKELLRVPFPLPGHGFIPPIAGNIIDQVSEKFRKLHTQLQNSLNNLKSNAERYYLFGQNDAQITKEWHRERERQINTLQNDLEPLIYSYFGLTAQEITLVEDTVRVFEPSSTPTTWQTPKIVTIDPIESAKVAPYDTQGLKAYADTLTNTINSWAEAECSGYRVCAEGGTDQQTGLAMVTVKLANSEQTYRHRSISQNLAKALEIYHSHASKEHGSLLYQRDIFLFQGEQIHIVRPNLLLNWTRTAALNDAARIFGEIALAQEES